MKFIRCFAYGLEAGETLSVEINGQSVEFSIEAAQVDFSLTPAVNSVESVVINPPAKVDGNPE